MPASACSTASLADRGGARFRLLTVRQSPRRYPYATHQTARSITILLARNPEKVAGLRAVAEIAAMIDAGEPRLDISERELLTDTAAIHERDEAGDLRGRVVLIPRG
jgi:hypothetical protein